MQLKHKSWKQYFDFSLLFYTTPAQTDGSKHKSGHYSLVTNGEEPKPLLRIQEVNIARGNIVQEMEVIFTDRSCGKGYALSCEKTHENSCFKE